MILSRRQFACSLGAAALSGVLSGALPASGQPSGLPTLGLNTWSLRFLPGTDALPIICRVMRQNRLRRCQLLFTHTQPPRFDPDFASLMDPAAPPPNAEQLAARKQKESARSAWLASVPLSHYTAIRDTFTRQGLTISAFSTPLGDSPQEVDRAFLTAKALGASMLITRLSEAQTDLAAAAAATHDLPVGIQFSNPDLLARQLRVSSRFSPDPDLGDLTKAGISSLDFVQQHLATLSVLDLKDALPHGPSVPFGTGQAQIAQVLSSLVQARSQATVYIDCDYPGTGRSSAEIEACVRYIRSILDRPLPAAAKGLS